MGSGGGLYVIAFFGALVYFLQRATTFSTGVVGFFKALFWPAVVLYKVLDVLKL